MSVEIEYCANCNGGVDDPVHAILKIGMFSAMVCCEACLNDAKQQMEYLLEGKEMYWSVQTDKGGYGGC